ncbi:hypothetical protein OGAPHI_000589 [Ogataea philodendri]|uniref:Uncharacterized protein n=1 Tax=Ogataea philodendri TaxID=1378263 RepID=A0A9P8T915_9ASCO|nr:uncharacterized protein OGAPHI_000589 [Ogataea philodendri]KAH3670878.1 hypothetical protein OGAPHI_000589 [Ogataea philodendri]
MLFKPNNSHVKTLFSLANRVSLITGGSRGIGLAAAIGLAEAGSSVAITYNSSNSKHMEEVAKTFSDLGVSYKAYQCNVSSKQANEDLIEAVVKDFGRLDIVVPNAGICEEYPAEDYPEDAYRKMMAVNLDGAYFTAQAAANSFKKQVAAGILDQGRIVFTASVSASVVNFPQKQAPYNASKAGLVKLAQCLAVEWVDFARVNCVSPGYIETDILDQHPEEYRRFWMSQIPGKRVSAPYELKGIYVFLSSDASSYMTGADITVGGSYTLI